jgi:hypothetical protein
MPVKLQGAVALRKALAIVEPTLAKETTKEIASFLKPVVKQARGYMPSNDAVPSGWLKRPNAGGRWANRYYDQSIASRGVTYKTSPSKANRRGFRALASILNKPVGQNVGGLIYETAGRKSGITGKFTPKLGGQLVGQGQKMTGRAIFRAFEEDKGKAQDGVVKAIQKAAAKFDSMKDKV